MARNPKTPEDWCNRAEWARRKAAEVQAKLDARPDLQGYARSLLVSEVRSFTQIADNAEVVAQALVRRVTT